MKETKRRFKVRRWILLALGVLLLLLSVPLFLMVRNLQKVQRNQALIAAIKKNDTETVTALLNAGAGGFPVGEVGGFEGEGIGAEVGGFGGLGCRE